MLDGHIMRLRQALRQGKPPDPTATKPAPPAGGVPQPPMAEPQPSGTNSPLHAQVLHGQLIAIDALGKLQHGTIIETYQIPSGLANAGLCQIIVADQTSFYCGCCPVPNKGLTRGRRMGSAPVAIQQRTIHLQYSPLYSKNVV